MIRKPSPIDIRNSSIKDLRALSGRDVKNIVNLTNTIVSGAYQLDNIFLISRVNSPEDRDLQHFYDFMKSHINSNDIRKHLKADFSIKQALNLNLN